MSSILPFERERVTSGLNETTYRLAANRPPPLASRGTCWSQDCNLVVQRLGRRLPLFDSPAAATHGIAGRKAHLAGQERSTSEDLPSSAAWRPARELYWHPKKN